MNSYDVVIVGSGSSGGALAGRLTQLSDRRVLVLEGGPVYGSVNQMPTALLEPGTISAGAPGHPNNWGYLAEVRPGLKFPVPRGKGLGGSSSINGCLFVRGTKEDFDGWASAVNDEWSYEKVLPIFKRMESDKDSMGEHPGSDGPVIIRREPLDRAPDTNAFVAGCHSLGFADDPDRNAPGTGGVAAAPANIQDVHRSGTALAYLIPAMARHNFTIIGDAMVQRVIFQGQRAVGVEAVVDGQPKTFRGDEIVIAAGALRTPQILMLSGVGPADHLAGFGIPVVQDLSGVGQNLTDHPTVNATWDAKTELRHLPNRAPFTSLVSWQGDGSKMEIFPFVVKTGDLMGVRDVVERPVKALSAMRGTSVKAVTRQALMMRHALLGIVVFHEESRGSVTLQSADPQDAPVISFNLLKEEADRARTREAVRVTHELFQSQPLQQIGGKIVDLASSDLKDDGSLDKWVFERIGCGHPSCNCKMGPSTDPMAVVDQHLRVHAVEGLRIADTSVFPTITSAAPNATAVMIGDRLADFLV